MTWYKNLILPNDTDADTLSYIRKFDEGGTSLASSKIKAISREDKQPSCAFFSMN
jgi:hypothetical protein